jgi:hypothetical protein
MKWAFTPQLVLAGFLALSAAALAQSTTGRISGTVVDAHGGRVSAATVVVTGVGTGFSRSTLTDTQGGYVFVSLSLGTYSLSAASEGFKSQVRSGYVLVADGRLTADFRLEIGGQSEVVEVAVQGATVNTVSGEISRTIDRQQVQSLALNGATTCSWQRSCPARRCWTPTPSTS